LPFLPESSLVIPSFSVICYKENKIIRTPANGILQKYYGFLPQGREVKKP
jgi:hypothetical protein